VTIGRRVRRFLVQLGTLVLLAAIAAIAWTDLEGWPWVTAPPLPGADDPFRGVRVVELPRRQIPPPDATAPAFDGQDEIGARLNGWSFTNELPVAPYR
jgi:hypothetical protein